jgi:hypothetical protein
MEEYMEQETAPEVESQELQDVAPDNTEETQVDEGYEENEVSESEPQEVAEEAPAIEGADVEEEEELDPAAYAPQYAQPQQIPQIDPNQFIDETGQVDWYTYNAAQEQRMQAIQENAAIMAQNAVQQATHQMELKQNYQTMWSKAEDKYPELKGNKELKDMVQAIHAQSALLGKGKFLSPEKAAAKLFGVRSSAKAEGMKAASETRRVQSAAGLANPNPPAQAGSKSTKDLKSAMTTGSKQEREAARLAYLKNIL